MIISSANDLPAYTPERIQQIIFRHVDVQNTAPDGYASSFWAAARDARAVAGRDLDTGMSSKPPVAKWGAALQYMILIDHIASALTLKSPVANPPHRPNEQTPWLVAMATFGSLVNPALQLHQVYALYALRCCFAHDYSLINEPDKVRVKNDDKRRLLTHAFTLDWSPEVWLVRVPGDRFNDNGELTQATWINLLAWIDLCEDILSNIRELAISNKLALLPSRDVSWLQRQYGLRMPTTYATAASGVWSHDTAPTLPD